MLTIAMPYIFIFWLLSGHEILSWVSAAIQMIFAYTPRAHQLHCCLDVCDGCCFVSRGSTESHRMRTLPEASLCLIRCLLMHWHLVLSTRHTSAPVFLRPQGPRNVQCLSVRFLSGGGLGESATTINSDHSFYSSSNHLGHQLFF